MTTTQITPETLKFLLSPSDLIILLVLVLYFISGARRGLFRAVFGALSGLLSFFAAATTARLAAPNVARYLITPILGDVFEKKAQSALSSSAASAPLQRLLDSDLLALATDPLRTAYEQAAQSMAESLAYFLLFSILLVVFSLVLRMVRDTFHLLKKVPPIGALDALAGGILGLLFGFALCMLVLWVLTRFAPALFSEVGILSPSALEKTMLTKSFLRLIPQELLGTI